MLGTVTPRSQRLTISKLVPTCSAKSAWDQPLRLRARRKRSLGTNSSELVIDWSLLDQQVLLALITISLTPETQWEREMHRIVPEIRYCPNRKQVTSTRTF